jgi:hypothetical protein
MSVPVLPGDVILTRSKSRFGWLIRLGAAFSDRPNIHNHVIVAHHTDEAGTLWGIEGRPGGVGWVDCRPVLHSKWTMTNAEQPKTAAQRQGVCDLMVAMLGTPYDWAGIKADAMAAIGAQSLWGQNWHGQGPPGQIVCSALADWGYEHNDLASPGRVGSRRVEPSDWTQFLMLRGWT